MNIIEAKDLVHEFFRRDEEGNIEGISVALDKVDLNVFLPILQSQLGHQSLNSLSYYFHITNDVLKVVNKISEEELAYLISEVKYEE